MAKSLIRKHNMSGGRNTVASQLVMPDGDYRDAKNADMSSVVGAIKKDAGRSKKNSVALEGGSSIQGAVRFVKNNNTDYFDVVAVNGKAKINTSSTAYGLNILTGKNATERVRFVVLNDVLHAVNGTDAMWEWPLTKITVNSATVTNGDSAITVGPGTTLSSKDAGGVFVGPDSSYYTLATIQGAQSALLSTAYSGSSTTAAATIYDPPYNSGLGAPAAAPTASASGASAYEAGTLPVAAASGSFFVWAEGNLWHIYASGSDTKVAKINVSDFSSISTSTTYTLAGTATGAGCCADYNGGDWIYFRFGGAATTGYRVKITDGTFQAIDVTTNIGFDEGAKCRFIGQNMYQVGGSQTGNDAMEFVAGTDGAAGGNVVLAADYLVAKSSYGSILEYPGANQFLYYSGGGGSKSWYQYDTTGVYSDSIIGGTQIGTGQSALAECPFSISQYAQSTAVNNDKIVVVSESKCGIYSIKDNGWMEFEDLPSALGAGSGCVYDDENEVMYVIKGGGTVIWKVDLSPVSVGQYQFRYSYVDEVTNAEGSSSDGSSSHKLFHQQIRVTMVDHANTKNDKKLYYRYRSAFKDYNDDEVDDGWTDWYYVDTIVNGTTTYDFDKLTPDDASLIAPTDNGAPSSDFDKLAVFDGAMWAGNSYGKISYSKFDSEQAKPMPQAWGADDFLRLPAGESDTAIFAFRDGLFVGTANGIYEVVKDASYTPTDIWDVPAYYFRSTDSHYGPVNQDSVVVGADFVFFLSKRGPVIFNGRTSEMIGAKIENEFDIGVCGGLASGYLSNAVAVRHNDLIYLDVTGYGATTNNIRHVFDIDRGAWVHKTEGVAGECFMKYDDPEVDNDELYSGTSDGFIVRENFGTDQEGNEYEFLLRTAINTAGISDRNKLFIDAVYNCKVEKETFKQYRAFTGTLDVCKPKNSIYAYIIEMGTDDVYRFDHSTGRMEHFMNLPDTLGASGAWISEANPGYIVVAKGVDTTTMWFIDLSDQSYTTIDTTGAPTNYLGASACWSGEYVYVVNKIGTIHRLTTPLDSYPDGVWSEMTGPGAPYSPKNKMGVVYENGHIHVAMHCLYSGGHFDYYYIWNESDDSIYASSDAGDNPSNDIDPPYDYTSGTITDSYFIEYCSYSNRLLFYSFYLNEKTSIYELDLDTLTWSEIDSVLFSSSSIDMFGNGSFWYDGQHRLYFLSQETNTVLQRYHLENNDLETVSRPVGCTLGWNVDNRYADYVVPEITDPVNAIRYRVAIPLLANGVGLQQTVYNNNTGDVEVDGLSFTFIADEAVDSNASE